MDRWRPAWTTYSLTIRPTIYFVSCCIQFFSTQYSIFYGDKKIARRSVCQSKKQYIIWVIVGCVIRAVSKSHIRCARVSGRNMVDWQLTRPTVGHRIGFSHTRCAASGVFRYSTIQSRYIRGLQFNKSCVVYPAECCLLKSNLESGSQQTESSELITQWTKCFAVNHLTASSAVFDYSWDPQNWNAIGFVLGE